ncbi:MAG: 50S ribosomal protein L9 [Acidimicrobiia bacterium]|nr:50S ribosomal protein L9 [Acidimicrobiia bacterium]
MKLILREDVPDLGKIGDVVDVAEGYGRNYLVPRSLAVKVTKGAIAEAEKIRKTREDSELRVREAADTLAQALNGARVVVAANASDEGKLFGSIGASDIAEALKKVTGVEVDPHILNVEAPIKEIGLHTIDGSPHPDVQFQLTLDVIPA